MNETLQAAERLGLPVDAVLRLDTLVLAAVMVALAIVAGFAASRYSTPRLSALLSGRTTNFPNMARRAGSVVGSATSALLLIIAAALAIYGPYGRLLIVVALGLALGRLTYVLARAFRMSAPVGFILGTVIAIGSVASSLGGLQPLIDGLDRTGIRVGNRHISVLDLVNALIIIVLMFGLARVGAQVASRYIGDARGLDLAQRVLFQKLAAVAVIIVAFFIGIELLGIDLTALAVFSGAAGLAVGFGMQRTFSNLLSGFVLLMDRSIKPGDVLVVGDTFGWVTKIGARAVSIITRDGKEFLIPNEKLMTEQVENWSVTNRNLRIHIPVRVSHRSDIKAAQALMMQAAHETKRVLEDPEPNVWLTGFSESSIDHDIMVWINDPEEGIGNVKSAVLNRLWDLFREHGIEVPFPQADLHLRTLPPELLERLASGRSAD